jgi:hypothetical protein
MKYLFVILYLGYCGILQSQQNEDSLQIKQVEVVKAFEASITSVSKIHYKPQETSIVRELPVYTYTITNQSIPVADPVPVIKPLSMEPDPPFKVNNGYVRASYGHRKNPEVEAGYHLMQKDAYNGGVRLYYTSLDNTDKQPLQKFRTMGAAIYGQKLITENIQLFGNINSDFQRRNFYHTSVVSDTLSNATPERQTNVIGLTTGIRNAEETKSGISYECRAGVRNLTFALENLSEWHVNASVKATKKLGNRFYFKTEAGVENTHLSTEQKLTQFIFQITPTIKANFRKLSSEIGVRYLSSGSGNPKIFPVMTIQVPIKAFDLIITGEINQEFSANNIYNASRQNPWVLTSPDSLVNTVRRDFSLGAKGTLPFIKYSIRGGLQLLTDQMFFVNDQNDIRKFRMIFDSGSMWYLAGKFEKNVGGQLFTGGNLALNYYKLDNFAHAWHVPRFEGSVYVKTTLLSEKLALKGDFGYSSFSYYTDQVLDAQKTNTMTNLSFSGDYKIKERISITLTGMNILNNRFERWYGYPTIGTNIIVGCKVLL